MSIDIGDIWVSFVKCMAYSSFNENGVADLVFDSWL